MAFTLEKVTKALDAGSYDQNASELAALAYAHLAADAAAANQYEVALQALDRALAARARHLSLP